MSTAQAIAYRDRSQLYLDNAAEMLRRQRPEKTGEFLWGALVEALKAVAALKDIKLRTHAEIRRYARQVAKELDSEAILDSYALGETLHSNFYEGMFDPGEVSRQAARTRAVVIDMLLQVVPSGKSDEGGTA